MDDSGGGFVYRTDDELLCAMKQVAASPALRAEMGTRGYEAFMRFWSRQAHMKYYFDFLETIARQKLGDIPWQTAPKPGEFLAKTAEN